MRLWRCFLLDRFFWNRLRYRSISFQHRTRRTSWFLFGGSDKDDFFLFLVFFFQRIFRQFGNTDASSFGYLFENRLNKAFPFQLILKFLTHLQEIFGGIVFFRFGFFFIRTTGILQKYALIRLKAKHKILEGTRFLFL